MSLPFDRADQDTRAFYSKVFFNILLNANAVRMGLYPTLLCETDDPLSGLRWKEAVPGVMMAMKQLRRDF